VADERRDEGGRFGSGANSTASRVNIGSLDFWATSVRRGDPLNEVHVLHADGTPAGFVEFDRRVADEVEIVQFGLLPEFIGVGLGKWFLRWAIDRAWGYGPRRLWLHTCTLDHPAALPNYLKAGFTLYKEAMTSRDI
jgi:GNAT superfamily N-acetyltransferase